MITSSKFNIAALMAMFLSACISINSQNIIIDEVNQEFTNTASVEVEGIFCQVNINGSNQSNVVLTSVIKAKKQRDDIKVKYKQEGSTLKVWLETPNSLSGSFNGQIELSVPQNTNITVKNSSGSIHVQNIGQSLVQLTASSGSINAKDVDSNITCVASSGSINVDKISGNIIGKTSSGSQHISNIGGDAKIQCSSGSLQIRNINGNTDALASSGSIHISDINGDLTAKVSSGSLNLENVLGDVISKTSSGSIKMNNITGAVHSSSTSGSINGNSISLTKSSSFSSTSGSINIQLNNNEDELSFDLSASSGSLNAKGHKGHKRLRLQQGEILVKGNSSSGSQNYR